MLPQTRSDHSTEIESSLIDARVVFLTHYIPLYQVRVLESLAASIRDFHVLLSTPVEPNRDFEPDWSDLDVTVQKTWTLRRKWRHRTAGFDDPLYVHLPYDTASQLARLNPDVVMSLELGARSAGAALHCKRNPDTKLVLCTYMSERTELGRGILRSYLRRWLIGRADAITYNGPSCKRYLEQSGAPEENLFPLPYAADDRSIHRGPLRPQEPGTRNRLLVVGQLSQRKGVLPLMSQISNYASQRPDQPIELTFIGNGPLQSQIESQSTPDNLELKVLGNRTPSDLSLDMTQYGCLVAPTLADEWMLVVNEALHVGLPVVGSIHAQAVTTLIENGVNGFRYDPMIDGELASVLDQYFQVSADAMCQMRRAAQQSVANRTPQWAAAGGLAAVRHVMGMSATNNSVTNNRRDP
ncbi:Glycosyl transferases group 1 [Rubripirellula lacrimiformis]|uniref:Glycosyl transferases group 1 n=1 Tax=Rubripirellula lacrimiformis TaxID=1930273 RepID=A0A517N6X5_9BACT|nr:glycosyltransferase family 4 protein [Rubripirellula lacrimiformis]QDT02871.1 Glycosyl transferases group 1 [Rubripirellula lacrimiformis]